MHLRLVLALDWQMDAEECKEINIIWTNPFVVPGQGIELVLIVLISDGNSE